MQKLKFNTIIQAPKERVWDVLWSNASYRKWTSAFAEGSYAKTDNWKEGSKVLFLDSEGNGMVSMVAKNKPNEFMSFKHLGEIKDGVEDTTSDAVKAWSGSMENYTLKQENGTTTLEIEMDIADEFKEMFEKMWPEALKHVKNLSENRTTISISAVVNAPVEKAWECFTGPEHIVNWNFASDDWHCPAASNDLKAGGKFSSTMAAKDGSASFDFEGVYSAVEKNKLIQYTIADGRKVEVNFESNGDATTVSTRFEAENTHSEELQRGGWQAILDNFKKYTEGQ